MCANTRHGSPFSKETVLQLLRSRRVAVIGNQGAGKTTLAIKLAKIIGIEYVQMHVDWKRLTTPDKEEIKRQMAMRENWIVDGDFGLLDMAETVIHLDFPLFVCLWRACTRSIKWFLMMDFRSTNFAAILGRFTRVLRLLKEIYQYPFKVRSKPRPQSSSVSYKISIILKSPKELDLFLSTIKSHLMETGSEIGSGEWPERVPSSML